MRELIDGGRWIAIGGEWDQPAALSVVKAGGGSVNQLTREKSGSEPRWRPTPS